MPTNRVRAFYVSGGFSQSDTDYERSHASVDEAKKVLPSGDMTALIFAEEGTYFRSGRHRNFDWDFEPTRGPVSVPV